ncbi:hypothetical protein J2W42_006535 [Rhizobium tibeticum]|nr:hypothetical protein [Rhizobium tibeticum]
MNADAAPDAPRLAHRGRRCLRFKLLIGDFIIERFDVLSKNAPDVIEQIGELEVTIVHSLICANYAIRFTRIADQIGLNSTNSHCRWSDLVFF